MTAGTTGSGNRFDSELSCRFPDPVACALEERRPRHPSSSFNSLERLTPLNPLISPGFVTRAAKRKYPLGLA